MIQKHLIFIFAHAPYDSSTAREGLDALLAGSIFDQRISVVFIGDGVFQLLNEQSPVEQKSHSKMLHALSLYDINRCYVHSPSVFVRGLQVNQSCIDVTPLNDTEMQSLIASADHVLSF